VGEVIGEYSRLTIIPVTGVAGLGVAQHVGAIDAYGVCT